MRESRFTYAAQGPTRSTGAISSSTRVRRDDDVQPHPDQPVHRQRDLVGVGVEEAGLADQHVTLQLVGLAADLRPGALDVLASYADRLVPATDLDVGAVHGLLVHRREGDARRDQRGVVAQRLVGGGDARDGGTEVQVHGALGHVGTVAPPADRTVNVGVGACNNSVVMRV